MQLLKVQQQQLHDIGQRHGLTFLVLHGSAATDKAKPGDVDIAYLTRGNDNLRLLLQLQESLEPLFPGMKLDIGSLATASPLFRVRATGKGVLLFGDQREFQRYKVKALMEHCDSESFYALQARLREKKLAYLGV